MVRLAVILASAGLAGCSAAACDPSQAGFISGIGCASSGAYSQRTQALQTQLTSSRSAALQERANAIEADQEASDSQVALADTRARLGAVDRQNAALAQRLAALRASNRVDQTRLANAQAQFDAISRRRATLAAAPDDGSVLDLQRQQQRLLGVMKGMGDL